MNKNLIQKHFSLLEKQAQGKLGISACHLETKTFIEFNQSDRYLMCSTYKVAIATYALYCAEQNTLDLNKLYEVRRSDFLPGMYSSLNQLNYDAPQLLSLHSLLIIMLQESCNTATNIILNILDGTEAVHSFLAKNNLEDIQNDYYTMQEFAHWEGVTTLPDNCSIEEYEKLVRAASAEDIKRARIDAKEKIDSTGIGTTTPNAMMRLLCQLFNAEIISKRHSDLLFKIMRRCRTSANRIMGLLPPGTSVAHKTGSLTGYTCDIGLITLPHNAGNIAIALYLKDTPIPLEKSERVLAEVSRSIYDIFLFAS